MELQLKGSVGQGGVNNRADVLLVQRALNLVPPALGGPDPLLNPDAWIGPLTIGAIRQFQQVQFGWSDGRIDVGLNTITQLNEILQPVFLLGDMFLAQARAALKKFGIDTSAEITDWVRFLTAPRLNVLVTGLAEATPPPYGVVNDNATTTLTSKPKDWPQIVRTNWERLKDYHEYGSTMIVNMNDPDHRTGILVPGKTIRFVNQNTKQEQGLDWCGMFTLWVYRKASLWTKAKFDPRWMMSKPNFKSRRLPQTMADRLAQVQPGDICTIDPALNHHFIVVAPPMPEHVWGLSGNSDYHGITVKKWPTGALMSAWYSIDDVFL